MDTPNPIFDSPRASLDHHFEKAQTEKKLAAELHALNQAQAGAIYGGPVREDSHADFALEGATAIVRTLNSFFAPMFGPRQFCGPWL